MARKNGIFGTTPRIAKPLRGVGSSLGGDWTWKNTDENPEVSSFQASLNKFLAKYGYYGITVDGRLGPATCGAWLHLMNTVEGITSDPGFPGYPADNWGSVCQAWTYPTKIGSTTPESNPITKDEGGSATLPWLTYSDATVAAQEQINSHLVGHDMVPFTADGKMGSQTCGAMRWLDTNTGSTFLVNYGKNCQSFTDPVKKAASASTTAPTSTPVSIPATTDSPSVVVSPNLPVTSKPKVSTASMVTGGLLISGLAVLGYWYSKKKGLTPNRKRRSRRRR